MPSRRWDRPQISMSPIKTPIILDLETIHITLQNNGTTVNKQSCLTNLSG